MILILEHIINIITKSGNHNRNYYNIINKNISKRIGTHDGACHKLDIINQFVFISCSEDGTIKLIQVIEMSISPPLLSYLHPC